MAESWAPDGYVSVAEAAQMLGVSKKTVERRIGDGKLPAELRPSPYGQAYVIPESAIATATHTVHSVAKIKEHDLQTIGLALAKVNRDANIDLVNQMQHMVETQNQVITSLVAKVDQLTEQLAKQDNRDEQLMAGIRAIQERNERPWWKKIFG